jgi:ribonuclease P protein component
MNGPFGKPYHLCSKTIIDEIFQKGQTSKKYPFVIKVLENELPTTKSFQFLVSVPKRIHSSAVKRNRIKRQVREVIRKHKHQIENTLSKDERQLAIFIIYTSKDFHTFDFLDRKMASLLENLLTH